MLEAWFPPGPSRWPCLAKPPLGGLTSSDEVEISGFKEPAKRLPQVPEYKTCRWEIGNIPVG